MVSFLLDRPIATTMVYVALLVMGVVATTRLSVSLMPDIEIPEIKVHVTYPKFNARQMDESILAAIRNELQQVYQLQDLKSEAQSGRGQVTLSFEFGSNIDYSVIEVNEKIDQVLSRLPDDMLRPRITKASSIDIPVFTINVSSREGPDSKSSFLELSQFTENIIRRRIEQVSEVAFVDVSGTSETEILIHLDTLLTNQIGIDFNDISRGLSENNREVGSILVEDRFYQYNVKIGSVLTTLEELRDLPIKKNNRIYRLGDLSQITTVPATDYGLYDANGNRAIALDIYGQSDARNEYLSGKVKAVIEELSNENPDLSFEITRDQSSLLLTTISSLKQSLFIGGGLAFVILFIFLKKFRSAILIGISIPVSIIVSLLVFGLLGITINIISLSGLLLGVGMMIDNSIIVIDNIFYYISRKESVRVACVLATKEVFRPLFSSVLTSCAVFLPLVFLSGVAGALFYDQALAVTIGLFSSLLVAVTLIPVYFYLLNRGKSGSAPEASNEFSKPGLLTKVYLSIHYRVMRNGAVSGVIMLLLALGSIPVFNHLEKAKFPVITEEAGLMEIDWDEDIYVEENHRRVNDMLKPMEAYLDQYNSMIGQQQFSISNETAGMTINEARIYYKVKDEKNLDAVTEYLKTYMEEKFSTALYEFSSPVSGFGNVFQRNKSPLTAKVRIENTGTSNSEYSILYDLERSFSALLPNLTSTATATALNISIDYEAAALYEVEVDRIIEKIETLLNEFRLGEVRSFQRIMEIKAASVRPDFFDLLETTYIENLVDKNIRLKNLISTSWSVSPKRIFGGKDGVYYPIHFDISQRELEFYMAEVSETTKPLTNVNATFAGNLIENAKLYREMLMVFAVALVLLYVILASQFESTLQPLIILLEIPLCISAALFGLMILDSTLNVMSMIGIIVMSGIIINDSILKIDTINNLRNEGLSVREATVEAGRRRLRPIIMTSLTTILAMTPFLFSRDLGSEIQRPLAITVIFGMMLGTFVSLFCIPLFYQWFVRDKKI